MVSSTPAKVSSSQNVLPSVSQSSSSMIAELRNPRLTPHSTKSPSRRTALTAAHRPMWTRHCQS